MSQHNTLQSLQNNDSIDVHNFSKYDSEINASISEYLTQLSPLQRKAIKIAHMHLGTSFNILKSNGYIDWKKK